MGCSNNQLSSLNVSANTKLTSLECYNNQLTKLDLSANTKLTELSCYRNKIKANDMQKLVESLPMVSDVGEFYAIDTFDEENEGNVITKSQVAIATGKKWTVYEWNGDYYDEYAGSEDTPTSINNSQLTIDNLNGDYYTIDGVKLSGEPTQKGVYIIKGKKVKR